MGCILCLPWIFWEAGTVDDSSMCSALACCPTCSGCSVMVWLVPNGFVYLWLGPTLQRKAAARQVPLILPQRVGQWNLLPVLGAWFLWFLFKRRYRYLSLHPITASGFEETRLWRALNAIVAFFLPRFFLLLLSHLFLLLLRIFSLFLLFFLPSLFPSLFFCPSSSSSSFSWTACTYTIFVAKSLLYAGAL